MKKHKEKELNAFLEKTTKVLELEQAPKDFMQSVMQQVEIHKVNTHSIRYTPLVSTNIWIGITVVVVALFWFLGFENNHVSGDWFSVLRLNTIGNVDFLDVFPTGFSVSDSTIYALVGLLVFLGIQVIYLKQFFANREVLL
jgi:hypothetical protein